MIRHRLQVIECYEVLGQPVVSSSGLVYRPIIDLVTQPYRVTSLPVGHPSGLSEALARARHDERSQPPALAGSVRA